MVPWVPYKLYKINATELKEITINFFKYTFSLTLAYNLYQRGGGDGGYNGTYLGW